MTKERINKKKQLGVDPGTAAGRLRKILLFSMATELDRTLCFQCGERIETIEEFSIEHKVPWLNSKDPKMLFFDVNNIAFSHLKCNIQAARKPHKYTTEIERIEAINKNKELRYYNTPKEIRKARRRAQYLKTGT